MSDDGGLNIGVVAEGLERGEEIGETLNLKIIIDKIVD